MQEWEHLRVHVLGNKVDNVLPHETSFAYVNMEHKDLLHIIGNFGWKMVGFQEDGHGNTTYIFKRPKE